VTRRSSSGARVRHARPVVVSIAGSDPTGGAGLQADLKTFERMGVAGAAVVTSVTAQTATELLSLEPVSAPSVQRQLDAVLATLRPRAVKCGLLATRANVAVVAKAFPARRVPLVVDPVTVASGGARLGERGLLAAIVERLFPLAAVVTVNLGEAEAILRLSGGSVHDEASMRRAGSEILGLGPRAVVVKGGHLDGDPVDVLVTARGIRRFRSSRLPHGMHGTGCAFASAIAAGLACGHGIERAVRDARLHVRALLRDAIATKDGGWLRG
jgi:hydroxymethylpyrimidine/phosphomethylpyrimidine kinase